MNWLKLLFPNIEKQIKDLKDQVEVNHRAYEIANAEAERCRDGWRAATKEYAFQKDLTKDLQNQRSDADVRIVKLLTERNDNYKAWQELRVLNTQTLHDLQKIIDRIK